MARYHSDDGAGAPVLAQEVATIVAGIVRDERRGDVITARLGLNGARPTLAEAGDALGLTRERIRQIVQQVVTQFGRQAGDDLAV